MDLLSAAGLLLGLVALIGGNYFEGGSISALLNLPAAAIVLGGTVGAVMLQSHPPVFRHALRLVRWAFFPPPSGMRESITKITQWSVTARRDGLLGLESLHERETDPFARKGLQLLIDGIDPPVLSGILEVELIAREERDMQAAKIFEAMGGYAPTIGIIGAVLGLMHVMGNLADPGKLGGGIATAFIATVYGVGLANLLFLPIAAKIRTVARRLSSQRAMIIDGLLAIADGENPRLIEMKLAGYLEQA